MNTGPQCNVAAMWNHSFRGTDTHGTSCLLSPYTLPRQITPLCKAHLGAVGSSLEDRKTKPGYLLANTCLGMSKCVSKGTGFMAVSWNSCIYDCPWQTGLRAHIHLRSLNSLCPAKIPLFESQRKTRPPNPQNPAIFDTIKSNWNQCYGASQIGTNSSHGCTAFNPPACRSA